MKNTDDCDMEEFGRLFVECIEDTISILGDCGHARTNRKGIG